MVVRVFLFIACFVKIAVCSPYTSMINKFPTMTTSYATNILPEEYADNIPYYDGTRPSILQEMSYPTEEIRLNYPSILSRPMAITPLPMPRDLSAELFVPEINFPNNAYAPAKSACYKNYNYDSVKPKFINDIPAPKYQFKPFSESYNAFRENLFKNSELNLRSNAMIPQYNVFDDFGITDNRNYPMYDLDNILSPPLKIPLQPQGTFELPIQKPFIDYNFNTYQDNFDGLENIRIKNEIPSPVYPGPSEIFFNQAMTLDDGKFLEGEIQFPGTSTLNNNNPFDSSLLNQQLLLINNFALPEKQSKRTTDLNNLSNFDIDINIAENTCSENIPIEITISDASDILISTDNGEASCIIIDICNENSEKNECFTNQVQIRESDAPPCPLPSEPEKVVVDTQNINSIGFENFSLKDFSIYLAESILSALQTYALQPISSNPKDNKANEPLTCADKTATSFDKSVAPSGPTVPTKPNESLNTNAKSRDKIKANKMSQTSPVLNNTENKYKAPSNANKSTDDPTNMTLQTSLPLNKDNKMPDPCSPACTCKILDKSKDISTDKTSQSSKSINKTSEVAPTITASPIISKGKDMSKDIPSQTLLSSNNINKTSEIASTVNKCSTTSKGKDIYTDLSPATQTVIKSNSTNKTSDVVSTTETAPISNKYKDISTNKVPQISLSPENKDEISIAKSTIDAYPVSNKSTDTSTDNSTKTTVPPKNTDVMSEASSTNTKTCTPSQTPSPQRDKVAEKPSDTKPKPCISTVKINISPLKDNLQQIVVFV